MPGIGTTEIDEDLLAMLNATIHPESIIGPLAFGSYAMRVLNVKLILEHFVVTIAVSFS